MKGGSRHYTSGWQQNTSGCWHYSSGTRDIRAVGNWIRVVAGIIRADRRSKREPTS
ncbi:hypothetical protein [Sporosarcina cyprini]|uniref:hypothetical protein n=1 Tax=Sporosarcina cyprini TaxID=2910523 RepID=UPI001EDFFB7C|nr:hypothetical protein [Sporosarcina cyprini]MCG3087226.1 hypothetical protein [Sporosarcina cyprini]